MPTDPFVPETLDAAPRQLPNLAPGVRMPPAGAWAADRPGELSAGQPHGALLGSPGPNVGYALLLVERRRDRFMLAPQEHHEDAAAVVAELAMKRASAVGRAPVLADVDVAMELLGYAGPDSRDTERWRRPLVDDAAHDYAKRRRIVDAVSVDVLRLVPARIGDYVPETRVELVALARELDESNTA